MERIKLAIERARESAVQRQDGNVGAGEPPPGGSSSVRSPASPPRVAHQAPLAETQTRRLPLSAIGVLLAGLVLGAGYWLANRSDARPAPAPAGLTASPSAGVAAAPVQPIANLPAPAPPAPAEPSREMLTDQVQTAVEAWRQAWSARDMVAYLGAYSDTFVPSDGSTREAWLRGRYRNVGGRDAIDVTVRDLNIESVDASRARVSFVQDYVSGGLREMNRPKTLDLARADDGRWRIIAEWQGKELPAR